MTDRTTKLLLAAIALGLWANVLAVMVKPVSVAAQDMSNIERYLRSIESDVDDIEDGTCSNGKIC